MNHTNDLPDGLSKPARQALATAGIRNLEDLARMSESEVLALHGIGPKSMPTLREALAERSESFTGERR